MTIEPRDEMRRSVASMMTVSVTCAVSAKTHEVREDDLVPA